MSGSSEVNARLSAWEQLIVHTSLAKAMDDHISRSEEYAKANHRWNDPSGVTTGGLMHKTEVKPAQITSTIYGGEKTNLWLDQAWFFQGRYKLIERARSNNLLALWTRLRAIMKGSGFIRGG